MTEYKKLYDNLLKSGDLFEVFPDAVGEWSADRKGFIELQDEMEYNITTENYLDEDAEEKDYFFED